MALRPLTRRASFLGLCATPFLVMVIAAQRSLRIPGVHQAIGALLFAAICLAAWTLGARAITERAQDRRQLALAGALLITPFAIMALLWTGLGPPWMATPAENQMRYLVLIAMAGGVASGFIVLKEALGEAGERFYSAVGFAAILLAGPLYLFWNCFMFGAFFAREHAGQVPVAIVSLNEVLDLVLFLGGALTYVSTAAFATALGRAQWLGRKCALIYLGLCVIALFFLFVRGLQYPDPAGLPAPWYASPGFIAGIPAVPFVMPFLLGVVVLRRAGDEQHRQ